MFLFSEIKALDIIAQSETKVGFNAWWIVSLNHMEPRKLSDFLSEKEIECIEQEPQRLTQLINRVFNPKHNRELRTIRCKIV